MPKKIQKNIPKKTPISSSKICSGCREEKDLGMFSKDKLTKTGFSNWCKDCHSDYARANKKSISKRMRKWYYSNRERMLLHYKSDEYKDRIKRRNEEIKDIVFEEYGNKCTCCGEMCQKLLAIDHVNNDGHKDLMPSGHRNTGRLLWLKIIREGFPDKYQILCFSCNWGKHINNGKCPHKDHE